MRLLTAGLALLATTAAAPFAAAQTPLNAAATTRIVVAATKLPTVTDGLRHFRLVRVTLPRGERSSASGDNGVLYQVAGSTEVSGCGDAKVLNAGEGLLVASGKACQVKAGGAEPSVFLHFMLPSAAELDRQGETPPAADAVKMPRTTDQVRLCTTSYRARARIPSATKRSPAGPAP
jgi:hypothetical protein